MKIFIFSCLLFYTSIYADSPKRDLHQLIVSLIDEQPKIKKHFNGIPISNDGLILVNQDEIEKESCVKIQNAKSKECAISINTDSHVGKTIIRTNEKFKTFLDITKLQSNDLEPLFYYGKSGNVNLMTKVSAIDCLLQLPMNADKVFSSIFYHCFEIPNLFQSNENKYFELKLEEVKDIILILEGGIVTNKNHEPIGMLFIAQKINTDNGIKIKGRFNLFSDFKKLVSKSLKNEELKSATFGIAFGEVDLSSKPKIEEIKPQSAGEIVGLKKGDCVLSINKNPTNTVEQFIKILREYDPDEIVKIKILRANEELEFTVKLKERMIYKP